MVIRRLEPEGIPSIHQSFNQTILQAIHQSPDPSVLRLHPFLHIDPEILSQSNRKDSYSHESM